MLVWEDVVKVWDLGVGNSKVGWVFVSGFGVALGRMTLGSEGIGPGGSYLTLSSE